MSDVYIVTTFIEKIINLKKIDQERFGNLSRFINPFSYLDLSNLETFCKLKYSAKVSDKETKSFIKSALNDFYDSKNSRIYVEEALEII